MECSYTCVAFLFAFLLFQVNARSQGQCVAEPSGEQMNFLDFHNPHDDNWSITGDYTVYVFCHILKNSSGNQVVQNSTIETEFERVNEAFEGTGVQFEILGFQTIDDESLRIAERPNLQANYPYLPNAINIYYPDSIESEPGYLVCGFAAFPQGFDINDQSGRDVVVIAPGCAGNGSTTAHELGHYFGLFHTHQGTGCTSCLDGVPEYDPGQGAGSSSNAIVNFRCNVDRTFLESDPACWTTGDRCCDTKVDPVLIKRVDDACDYEGTINEENFNAINCIGYLNPGAGILDINGLSFAPSENNLMSYARKNCRSISSGGHFTEDQKTRINYYLHHSRSYLLSPINQEVSVISPQNTTVNSGSPFEVVWYSPLTSESFDVYLYIDNQEIQKINSSPVTVSQHLSHFYVFPWDNIPNYFSSNARILVKSHFSPGIFDFGEPFILNGSGGVPCNIQTAGTDVITTCKTDDPSNFYIDISLIAENGPGDFNITDDWPNTNYQALGVGEGAYQFGPYPNGSSVNLSIADNTASCLYSFQDLTDDCSQQFCPPKQLSGKFLPPLLWPLEGGEDLYHGDYYRFGSAWNPNGTNCGGEIVKHNAIDIGMYSGSIVGKEVYAASGGVIKFRFRDSNWEWYICIEHEENGEKYTTNYWHLENLEAGLAVGQVVEKGDLLGKVADLNNVNSPPHLHFGIRKGPYPGDDQTDLVTAGHLPTVDMTGNCSCTYNSRTRPLFPENWINPKDPNIEYEDLADLTCEDIFSGTSSSLLPGTAMASQSLMSVKPILADTFVEGVLPSGIRIRNEGQLPFEAYYALALHSAEGVFIKDLDKKNVLLYSGDTLRLYNEDHYFFPGDYKIYVKYSLNDADWVTIQDPDFTNPYPIHVVESTEAPDGFKLLMNTAFSISPSSPLEIGEPVQVTVEVKNIGKDLFVGDFYLTLKKEGVSGLSLIDNLNNRFIEGIYGSSASQKESLVFSTNSLDVAHGPGAYQLYLFVDPDGMGDPFVLDGGAHQNPINVQVVDPSLGLANIEVNTSGLDFGKVNTSGSAVRQFEVSSPASSVGVVQVDLSIDGGPFSIISGNSSFELQPGEKEVIEVAFAPLNSGDYQQTLSVTHDAVQVSPITIGLAGEAVQTNCDTVTIVVGTIPSACGQNNGQIYWWIEDGVPPFSVVWSTGASNTPLTNLSAGVYTVSVTDGNGCLTVRNYEVSSAEGPVIDNIVTQAAQCNSPTGWVEISIDGGTQPYSVKWSTNCDDEVLGCGAVDECCGLYAGTYSVTVTDDLGCEAVETFIIPSAGTFPEPTNIQITDVSCFGYANGSIQFQVAGGTPPYQYSHWYVNSQTRNKFYNFNDSATVGVLKARPDHHIDIMDANGCRSSYPFEIQEPSPLSSELFVEAGKCNQKGSAHIIVSGGSGGYSHQWSTGDTLPEVQELGSGTYSVMVQDEQGCAENQVFSVGLFNGASADFDYTINNLEVFFTNHSAAGDQQIWYFGDGNSSVLENPIHQFATPGTYQVCLQVANSCSSDSLCRQITVQEQPSPDYFSWDYGFDFKASGLDVLELAEGGYLILARRNGELLTPEGLNQRDNLLIRVNPQGQVLWSRTLETPYRDDPKRMVRASDGNFFIAGSVRLDNPINEQDIFLCKVNPLGEMLWHKAFGRSGEERLNDMKILSTGELLLAGYSESYSSDENKDVLVMKTTAEGEIIWSRILGSDKDEEAHAVIESSNGLYYLTGYRYQRVGGQNDEDILFLEMNANGQVLEKKLITSTGGAEEEEGIDLVESHTVGSTTYFALLCYADESFGFSELEQRGNPFLLLVNENGAASKGLLIRDTLMGWGDMRPNRLRKVTTAEGGFEMVLASLPGRLLRINQEIDTVLWYQAYGKVDDFYSHNFRSLGDKGVAVVGPSKDSHVRLVKLDSLGNSGCFQESRDYSLVDVIGQISVSNFSGLSGVSSLVPETFESLKVESAESQFSGYCPSCETEVFIANPVSKICVGDSLLLKGTQVFSQKVWWTLNGLVVDSSLTYWYFPDGTGQDTLVFYGTNGLSTCVDSSIMVVEVNPAQGISLSADVQPVSCFGGHDGEIILNVSGTGTPFHYLWNTGDTTSSIAELKKGNYQVQVFNQNGCRAEESYAVPQSAAISIQKEIEKTTCSWSEGEIEVSLSGGVGPYQYFWSTGDTSSTLQSLSAGAYYLTVTDSLGCQKEEALYVQNSSWLLSEVINLSGPEGGTFFALQQDTLYLNRRKKSLSILDPIAFTETDTIHFAAYPNHFGSRLLYYDNYCCEDLQNRLYALLDNKGVNGPGILAKIDLNQGVVEGYLEVGDSLTHIQPGAISNFRELWIVENIAQADNLEIRRADLDYVDTKTLVPFEPVTNFVKVENDGWFAFENNNQIRRQTLWRGIGSSTSIYYTKFPVDAMGIDPDLFLVTGTDAEGNGFLESYLITQNSRIDSVGGILPNTKRILISNDYVFLANDSLNKIQVLDKVSLSLLETLSLSFKPFDLVYHEATDRLFVSCLDSNKVFVFENKGPFSFDLQTRLEYCDTTRPHEIIPSVQHAEAPLAWSWSTGDTSAVNEVFQAGNYSLTVQDANGCAFQKAISIDSMARLNIEVDLLGKEYCDAGNGEAAVAILSGEGPFRVTWNTGLVTDTIGNLNSGLYPVLVQDSLGCIARDTVEIPDTSYALQTSLEVEQPFCDSLNGRLEVAVQSGESPYRVAWNTSDTGMIIQDRGAGYYEAEVMDANGCFSRIDTSLSCESAFNLRLDYPLTLPHDPLIVGDTIHLMTRVVNTTENTWHGCLFLKVNNQESLIPLGSFALNATVDTLLEIPFVPLPSQAGRSIPISIGFSSCDSTSFTLVPEHVYENPIFVDICLNEDQDQDGFLSCEDCNDNDSTQFPGQIWYLDQDGDGYGSGDSIISCEPGLFYYPAETLISLNGDCDDACASCYPGAPEQCDGLDNNCDGQVDEGACLPGCTNPNAHNYNPQANQDDGSCETCTDGVQNGDETSIDCGGTLCPECPVSCPPTLTLQGTLLSSVNEAQDSLIITATVPAGEVVVATAGQMVALLPDAWIQPGADFHAYIDTCSSALAAQEASETTPREEEDFIPDRREEVSRTPSLQIIPNPASSYADVWFELPETGPIELWLADLSGKPIVRLQNERAFPGGLHQVRLDRGDLPSGLYLVVLQTSTGRVVEKMVWY